MPEPGFKLIVGEEKVLPVIYHVDPSTGFSPNIDILVGFPPSSVKDTQDLIFAIDNQLLGTGLIKFKFEKNKINNTPKLKI
jgi:hypothetical protein